MSDMQPWWDEPHDVFLDITPIITSPFGDPFTLGTVRYKVPKEWVATRSELTFVTQPIYYDGYPNSAMQSRLHFKIETHWTDQPQPEPLPVAPEVGHP